MKICGQHDAISKNNKNKLDYVRQEGRESSNYTSNF